MKIYIAGKITGLERKEAEEKFLQAKKQLEEKKHCVFIPTVLPVYEEVAHSDYLHICHSMIDICDAIYMLDNWQTSDGARNELEYALAHNKEILYEDLKTLKELKEKENKSSVVLKLNELNKKNLKFVEA